MHSPIRSADEPEDLLELRRYRLLDTPPDEALDDLTALAAQICETPMAAITLLDEGRLWFKSKVGIPAAEIPRGDCFCTHTANQHEAFIVPNATLDPRFANHPVVKEGPSLRFYAGIPLRAPGGQALGALCVLDRVPRQVTEAQISALKRLARQVMAHFERHRWQLELAEKNDVLGIVTESARAGLAIVDRTRRHLYASDVCSEILDRPLSMIVGQPVPVVLGEIYEKRVKALLDRAFAGERVAFETPLPKPDSDRHYTVTYEPRRRNGEVTVVVAVITEITQLKQTQAARQEAERLARSTVDALSANLCVLDDQGTIITTNEAWRSFTKSNSKGSLPGDQSENYLQFCDTAKGPEAEHAKAFADGIRRVLRGEKQEFALEYPCHSPWQKRWFVGRVTRFAGDGPVRLVVAHEDVTKRKEAEIARQESLERLQIVAKATSDAIWDWNPRTNAMVWNDGIHRLFGHPVAELAPTADSWSKLVHPEDLDRVQKTIRQAVDNNDFSWSEEYRFRRSDGTYAEILDRGSIIRDAAGKAARLVGAMQDVTERNKAELSSKRLAAIVESSADAIVSKDLNGTVITWNQDAEKLFGHSASEMIGKSILLVIPPDRLEEESFILDSIRNGKTVGNFETQRLTKDGRLIDVSVTASPIKDGCGRIIAASKVIHDISDRKAKELALQRSEEALKASEHRLNLALVAGDLGVWDWNPATNEVHRSERWSTMLGFAPTEISNRLEEWSSRIHPDDLEPTLALLRNHFEGRTEYYQSEHRMRAKDGSYQWVQDRGLVTSRAADGKVLRMVGVQTNITARKLADEERDNLMQMIQHSHDLIGMAGLDGKIRFLNQGGRHLLGIRPDEDVSVLRFTDYVPEDWQDFFRDTVLSTAKTKGEWEGEMQLRHLRTGELIDVFRSVFLIRDSSGQPKFLATVTHDITARKRSENALRASEEMLRMVTDNARIGLVVVNRERRYTYCNAPFQEMTGLPDDRIVGAHICDVEGAVYEDQIRPVLDRVFLGERLTHEVARPTTGGIQHVLARLEPIFEDGTVTQVVAVISDITDRKKAQIALLESEERLRTATDAARVGLVMIDEDYRYTYANAAYLRILDLTQPTIVGLKVADVLPEVYEEQIKPRLEQAFQGGPVSYELTIPSKKSGESPRIYNVAYQLTENRGNPEIAVVIVDITQSKVADLALRESEARFRQLAENIEEVFWITDPNKNRVLYLSPAYEKVWGRSCESVYQSPRTWLDAIHPDDRDRVIDAALTKQTGGTYDETYRIRRPDGTERWIRDRAYPLRNAAGEIHRIVGTATDITAQRHLEEQFRQAQKMEAIGQLAGGVAHDFNNILAAMMMQADLASLPEDLPADSREFLNDIKASAERAAKLTRQLLAFSRRQVMQPRDIDLNDLVTSISKMLMRTLGEDVRLQLDLHSRPLLAHADAGMIDQVLLNLVVNARDAMPNGGRLVIETSEKFLSAAEAAAIPETAPGHYACLRVTDNGTGIPPELLGKIFEPFFTTKDAGKGTGLGLATVFGIVKQHGGSVTVHSTVGMGTTFQILLPLVAESALHKVQPAAKPKPRGGTETILVVEDEHALRLMTRFVLERAGYHVLEAASGVEALRVWEEHGDSVQLLLTDIVMPDGISGRELAERLRRVKPDLRVIFTSGYSADIAGRELSLLPGQNFIQKPTPPDQLLDTIRQSLDA